MFHFRSYLLFLPSYNFISFKKEINPINCFNSMKHSGWIYIVFKYYSIPKQAFEVQVKVWWLLNENSTTYTVFLDF
jgi:hypothetical protein